MKVHAGFALQANVPFSGVVPAFPLRPVQPYIRGDGVYIATRYFLLVRPGTVAPTTTGDDVV